MKKTAAKVVTRGELACDRPAAWRKVCFYEHVTIRPPLWLRLALPEPVESEGHHKGVGETSRCRYSDGGFLTKQITWLKEGERVDFVIVEQSIRYHRGVKLLGGCIFLAEAGEGGTSVEMVTYYRNLYRPSAIMDFFLRRVIRAMHRTTIRDMRCAIALEHVVAVNFVI
jgi:hypothetical protein